MLTIDGSGRATLYAALHFWREEGKGEPSNRTDLQHELATASGREISLGEEGIDRLSEELVFGCRAPEAVPGDDEAWKALAAQRRWSPAMLVHALGAVDCTYENETVIELPGDVSVHVSAYPLACDYVRVVDRSVKGGIELAYWTADEWRDGPSEVMGALMGLLKHFQPSLALEIGSLRDAPASYERTADDDQMAIHIARIATDEEIVDPEAARNVVAQRFPKDVWRHEVGQGDTQLGYWEWALHEAEAEVSEREAPKRAERGG